MRVAPLVLALSGVWASCAPAARPLTVFAAASLADVLAEVALQEGVPAFDLHVAGSEVLLRQVQAGAPADMLVMARALKPDEVPPGDRPVLLVSTRLVVAARPDAARRPATPADLPGRRLALADPALAPAGAHARAALGRAGLWQACAEHLLLAAHVRDACSWVVLGEADAVVCYRTDAIALSGISECFELGSDPVRYEALVVANPARRAAAQALLRWLRREPAQAVFRRHGFEP